jgi:hypothetical protein
MPPNWLNNEVQEYLGVQKAERNGVIFFKDWGMTLFSLRIQCVQNEKFFLAGVRGKTRKQEIGARYEADQGVQWG